ncbi:OLC1v1032959C1 [Oldenlandia corymbosa var. corymbosa]|uniref:OLC1v1032959C1 n=1 Tax=Oldenlandia corymbosa var. corymbosa TaxID=529605 RepID=A0AAV1CMB4_OLDCO|nr:OLC1v1032959C1 [Oldenlandia corymbosa var. corymbosa]
MQAKKKTELMMMMMMMMITKMNIFMSFFIGSSIIIINPTSASTDSFIYAGCTQLKFSPGTVYESNVNSALTSLVNSAVTSNFNNFKVSLPGSSQNDVIYALYQCRGDLSTSDCSSCVAHAVSQLGTACVYTSGGALQLDGCLVKYDNVSFFGTEDKTVALHRCGPSIGYDSDALTRRDAVLGYLTAGGGGGGQYFRVGGSGNVQGVAQCVQDLSGGECQDCLSDAIGRLKNECGSAAWGDMFYGKCYARYTEHGYHAGGHDNNDEMDKTLAIIIGGIAGVTLLVFLLSAFNRLIEKKGGK